MKKDERGFVTAIILAAGSGSRMGLPITKQKISLCSESILKRSVRAFAESDAVNSVIVVTREDELDWAEEELKDLPKIKSVIIGGKNRAESAYKGFLAVDEKTDLIAIHDGARCLVTDKMIRDVIEAAYKYGAATAATAVTDTLKFVGQDGNVIKTLPRNGLFSAQTPQVFSRGLYERAVKNIDFSAEITDDNMLIEAIGEKVFAVETGRSNIKITTSDDLEYANYLIERRLEMSETRVGHGYDVHRLVEGRRLVLGGVEIPHKTGLLGHSDADVLTHAVMDALLGSTGLGDIGRHFPDSNEQYKDISSLVLLEKVCDIINNSGFEVVNVDATLILQRPKVASYIDLMIDNYSKILNINRGRINIKATTEEHLGFTGREEGVSAHAVVTVKNKG